MNPDIRDYNRSAWDQNVDQQNRWTVPVGPEAIAKARAGIIEILLTPTKLVPANWFPHLPGAYVLCLASGGGQQGPLLAAAGAIVTVFDNSPRQLGQDRLVAERERLSLATLEGDMADLSVFPDNSFGLIIHPCSNCFVPDVRPVWRECFRVLQPGGSLLAGFTNPVRYLFDDERANSGSLEVRFAIPYSDLRDLTEPERQRLVVESQRPLEFGHSLADQLDGQLAAGFVLTGFFEDRYHDAMADPVSRYIDTFMATRAVKPASNESNAVPSA